jgi:hypothetical protein
MRTHFLIPFLLPFCVLLVFAAGCIRPEPPLPDVRENELITTLRLRFVNKANPADVVLATWKDLDGEGGNPPVIDAITLKANTAYTLTIDGILNETSVRSEDITREIRDDAHNHLFVYRPSGINLTITILDRDRNNLPFGMRNDANTGAPSTGTLQVILRHQVGTKDGTPTPGSTDIDTTFPVTIE